MSLRSMPIVLCRLSGAVSEGADYTKDSVDRGVDKTQGFFSRCASIPTALLSPAFCWTTLFYQTTVGVPAADVN